MAIEAVLVGAGQRGRYVYGAYALDHPDTVRLIAVVEPDDRRRDQLGDMHRIPPGRRYRHHDQVDMSADAWIIASSDRHHLDPALAALDADADVLVEKPIAATFEDSQALVRAAATARRQLHVAHVLRYTPFFTTLNSVVRSGVLGDIITVAHRENVTHWHMAHSFVRGNWARAGDATPMIVQKCCHDFDILEWNAASPVRRLHSLGSLTHFRPEHAPDGAPARCTDGCPAADTCLHEATRLYMNEAWTGWPVHVLTDDLSPEGRMHALKHGPYGRCVYTSGSDVVDHQVVAMEREDGS
ncbi:MAG: Gfo/Idh/MocA family oxidoreductase, partial [Acidimicrobiia bacterium]|nr:Gfo/Idh/MocA family oxidoreductase [Acidimicrobiia bacterium]